MFSEQNRERLMIRFNCEVSSVEVVADPTSIGFVCDTRVPTLKIVTVRTSHNSSKYQGKNVVQLRFSVEEHF